MTRLSTAQFKGLPLGIDPRRLNAPAVIDGKNFYVSTDGPVSGFSYTQVFEEDLHDPQYTQTLEAGSELFIALRDGIYSFDPTAEVFILKLSFSRLTNINKWYTSSVGGKFYYTNKDVGLIEYDQKNNLWNFVTGVNIPTTIVASTQSRGRLVLLSDTAIHYSSIDNGSDFAPSIQTGAGFQSLSLIGQGIPITIEQVVDGIFVFTEDGIIKGTSLQGVNPFSFSIVSYTHIPISEFAVETLGTKEIVFLTRFGLFSSSGGDISPWQPLAGEFIHTEIIPNVDLSVSGIIRLTFIQELNLFFISIADLQQSAIYNRALALYIPTGEWGSFDESHVGFMNVNFLNTELGTNFGFISADGFLFRFTFETSSFFFDENIDFLFDYHSTFEYPARTENNIVKFPDVERDFEYSDTQITGGSGLYDMRGLVEESLDPLTPSVIVDDTTLNSAVAQSFQDTYTDAPGKDINLHFDQIQWTYQAGQNIPLNPWDSNLFSGFISNNKLVITSGEELFVAWNVIPSSADYSVEADFINTSPGTAFATKGLFLREITTVDPFTGLPGVGQLGYQIYLTINGVYLFDLIPQGSPQLDLLASAQFTSSNWSQKHVKLIASGNKISVEVDSVEVISITNNLFSAPGRCGIALTNIAFTSIDADCLVSSATYIPNALNDCHVDNFKYQSSDASTPFIDENNSQEGIKKIGPTPVALSEKSLDSHVDLGLFRIDLTQENPDRFSMLREAIIGMLEESIGAETIDLMNGFANEVTEDLLVLPEEIVDYGFSAKNTTDYSLKVVPTFDGFTPYESQELIPSLVKTEGKSKVFATSSNGLYHIVRVSAESLGESYIVKYLDLDLFEAGRL